VANVRAPNRRLLRALATVAVVVLVAAGTSSPAAAEAVAANQRLYFLQFNVCNAAVNGQRCYGGDSVTAAQHILNSVGNASIMTFNEICSDTSYRVSAQFGPHFYIETSGSDSPLQSTGDVNSCPGDHFGLSLMSKRPLLDYGPEFYSFFEDGSTTEVRATACKRTVYLHTLRVCVTHVTSMESYRNSNILQVWIFTNNMRARGDTWSTVLGGDFNETPLSIRMDRFYSSVYSPPGYGFFREADHCHAVPGSAFGRCGDPTFAVGGTLNRKLDYIFFEPGLAYASASTATPSVSDHKILRAGIDIVA